MAAGVTKPIYVISFYGGHMKRLVNVPTLPASIELKQRITSALDNDTWDMLQDVWQELNYQLDMRHVTGGVHIEHLRNSYLSTPSLGQDTTQGQFLSGV